MSTRIGLVTARAEVAVDVTTAGGRAGVEVVPVSADDRVDPALAALVVDVAAGYIHSTPLDSRRETFVVHRAGEAEQALVLARTLDAGHVVELPRALDWLVARIGEPAHAPVLVVAGAVGGVGTTTVAIACAAAPESALLVDADPNSSGLDLPLGIPDELGARWCDIPDTNSPLDVASLCAALPTVAGITTVTGPMPDPGGRVAAVVRAGRGQFAGTVVDVGRGPFPPDLLGPNDPLVLVTPATLAGVVAGRRLLEAVSPIRITLVVRPTPWLPAERVAEQLGADVMLLLPRWRRAAELTDVGDLLGGRGGRTLRRFGRSVWAKGA